MKEVYQEAEKLYNAQIMIIYQNGDIETINSEQEWYVGLGKSCGRFSYKNELITLVGREKEKKWLLDFLNMSGNFAISAITGRAGNEKSSLVYSFYKNQIEENEWYVIGVSYEGINGLLMKAIMARSRVLLIIDYVLAYADEIGTWLKKLWGVIDDKAGIKVRVLLIERAHVIENREPYWYSALVKKHDLEEVCPYKNFLKLEDLEENDLKKIFLAYIKQYGSEKDSQESNKVVDKIFGEIDETCKTPLFVLYIAQAWLDDKKRNIRRWNREDLLTYVEKKEERRIELLFSEENAEEAKSLKKILVFSMMLSGIELGKGLPQFLEKEFEIVKKAITPQKTSVKNLFRDVGRFSAKEVRFGSALPEIAEEFYCLNYLKFYQDNLEEYLIEEIVNDAWKENSKAFTGFLCRTIEDFSSHEMVAFDGILLMPKENVINRVLYADVVREYTYWKTEVDEYFEDVIYIFEKLLKTAKPEEKHDIREKYAIALFNVIWNSCECDEIEYCVLAETKLKILSKEDFDIDEIYRYSKIKLFEENIFIE